MTHRQDLEILRGECIPLIKIEPMDIPCIETSDEKKLCKHPLVSVYMVTYNQEAYIRRAIEGVMMQQTDFEFELIIGEDASKDNTRAICFEYQKRHPDKIRVLWWHENVSRLGGNGRRVRVRCRGEFIASCEGDDYWIDPLKLQKQVDVMRAYPNVGLCHGHCRVLGLDGKESGHSSDDKRQSRIISSDEFVASHIFGWDFKGAFGRGANVVTPTALFRRSIFEEAQEKFDIFKWDLLLRDEQNYLGVGSISDVYFIADEMAVYRRNQGSSVSRLGGLLRRDHILVRMYFAMIKYNINPSDLSPAMLDNFRLSVVKSIIMRQQSPNDSLICHPTRYIISVLLKKRIRHVFMSFRSLPTLFFLLLGIANSYVIRAQGWYHRRFLQDGYSSKGYQFFKKYLEPSA